MKYLLINAVSWFGDILILLLFARAILSWFVQGPYNNAYKIYMVVCNLTEPIVAPCRRLAMRLNTGMLDLSVFFAFFLVSIARSVIIKLLIIFL
ncbi:YggT family protein [Clostridium aminobutyricum]|uniref:YggT family protein n=1 Tax=Clostridium aminobutyricum TaxID=33953 RepID=A0A939D6R1_CLOAM|nr:YggT family protein [Clostridium aminobutyricum]MBN7772101.1 YggT family protein [Clostridium aminobutyricum]